MRTLLLVGLIGAVTAGASASREFGLTMLRTANRALPKMKNAKRRAH
jgi:hypothetical protein